MSRTKMFLAGAVIAAASLIVSGPAFATPRATTFLFDDGPSGTTLVITVDGTVFETVGPVVDQNNLPNSYNFFVHGTFSFPTTRISILDPATSLVSDDLQISTGTFDQGSTLIAALFGSNDVSALPFFPPNLPISNPVFETGLVQTLFSAQADSGDTLTVQFQSDADARADATKPVPEPSTFALFGAALAALGLMMRRRSVSPRT